MDVKLSLCTPFAPKRVHQIATESMRAGPAYDWTPDFRQTVETLFRMIFTGLVRFLLEHLILAFFKWIFRRGVQLFRDRTGRRPKR